MIVSATYRPPKTPKCPFLSGNDGIFTSLSPSLVDGHSLKSPTCPFHKGGLQGDFLEDRRFPDCGARDCMPSDSIDYRPYLLMIFPPGLYLDAARDIHCLGFYRFQGRKDVLRTEPPGEDEGVAGRRFARQVPVAGLPRAAETDGVMGIDEKGPHRVIDHRGKLFFAPE